MKETITYKSTHPLGDTGIHDVKCNVLNAVQDEEIASLKMDRDFERERGNWYRDKLQANEQSIKRLEEELIDAKGQWAALVADVVLYEDRGERIKRLEEAGDALLRDNDDMENINRWRKAKEVQ